MDILLGVSASSGIGVGKAFVLPESKERTIPEHKISPSDIPVEWSRFQTACDKTKDIVVSRCSQVEDDSQRDILTAQLVMLEDLVFIGELKKCLEDDLVNIETIIVKKVKEYADKLKFSGNQYLEDRAQDIEDVFDIVLDNLLNYKAFDIETVPDGCVIVAKSMKTSDTVILSKRKIAGLALTEGGISSHVGILAKSFGIPCIVGLENIWNIVQNDELLIVDGKSGQVTINPDESTIAKANTRLAAEKKYFENLKKLKNSKACTNDGTEFKLMANIGTIEEAKLALENGADGIGLFRTEFLFMDEVSKSKNKNVSFTNTQSEEAQFQAYKTVLEMMEGKSVTIRTLDTGGDKLIASSDIPKLDEKNPLMGLRAIRLSLYYPQVLRTQLRALYRASVYGNLRIMLPLVTDVSQVNTVMGIAKGVQLQLKEEGISYNPDVPLGIMVETAAAAICSDCFAKACDFFSLGTNDLTQYTLGVDRENPAAAPLYNEFNLAVLRLIENTIKNAKENNLPISVCGEMAGSKESAIILAGMGIRTLSMSPKNIPVIKDTLAQFSITELENLSKSSFF